MQRRNVTFLGKKIPNQTFRCQISFGLQLQTFPYKCNTRKLQPKSWRTENKDSFYLTMQFYSPTQWKKEKSIQFHSVMSWPHFSTRSKTCMHLKKYTFSSLLTLKTHFRHKQGHQRAVAFSGSIEDIQKTTTAVNSVERQKTVNIGKKL